jgi:hypothetical protein
MRHQYSIARERLRGCITGQPRGAVPVAERL